MTYAQREIVKTVIQHHVYQYFNTLSETAMTQEESGVEAERIAEQTVSKIEAVEKDYQKGNDEK